MRCVASDEHPRRPGGTPDDEPPKPTGWAAPSAEQAATVRAVVAENVRRERKARGLTQLALADACGVAENTISRLEKPDHEPRILTCVAVAFALDVPVLNILRGIPGSPRTTNRN